jgi:hypothetical protein
VPEPRNPFLAHLKIEFVVGKSTSFSKGPRESGKETIDYFYRERAEKTAVYKTEAFYHLIPTLKSCSKDLLLFIIMNLQWGKDLIRLDRDRFCDWSGQAVQTFYNAKNELIDVGVITKYKGADYWINPAYFFKGDRFKYAHNNDVQVLAYKKQQQQNG